MKIDGENLFILSQSKPDGSKKGSGGGQVEKVEPLQKVEDRLEVSTAVRELQTYLDRIKNAPEVRAQKVAEISRQLEAGTYNIKAEKVAEAIIKGSLVNEVI